MEFLVFSSDISSHLVVLGHDYKLSNTTLYCDIDACILVDFIFKKIRKNESESKIYMLVAIFYKHMNEP